MIAVLDRGSLVVILPAVLLGVALGALGARRNGVRYRDERVLWMVGAASSALNVTALGAWGAHWAGFGGRAGAGAAVALWALGSLACAALTPRLDARESRGGWVLSALLKTLQCPLSTLAGLLVALLRGATPRIQTGAWLSTVGEGRWAVALGAFVLAQRGVLDPDGRLPAHLARHESYHTRNAACLGESGFYLVYLTLGAGRAALCHAPWNGLARDGRGNPFERTAYAIERESRETFIAHRG